MKLRLYFFFLPLLLPDDFLVVVVVLLVAAFETFVLPALDGADEEVRVGLLVD